VLEKSVNPRAGLDFGTGLACPRFQYDTDQRRRVPAERGSDDLCRFGTRSDQRVWYDDVSIDGLAKAREGALALHQDYPRKSRLC